MFTNLNTSVPQPIAELRKVYPYGIPTQGEFSLDGQDYLEFSPSELPHASTFGAIARYLEIAPVRVRRFFVEHQHLLIPIEWVEAA
ncbi:hypothetical protein ACQ4M4_12760 [Leptolyngbya sp. AN02str]|uniref:hypothetical protein n=1 Tax=Leptolyngbya sp. AN02str TaxID=3423363 RepID=UPI003D31A4A9